MKKNKKEINLDGIDAESIIHSFRTTDHLQMAKNTKGDKNTHSVHNPMEASINAISEKKAVKTETTDIPEIPKDKNCRNQDYESLFIRDAGGITAREGKTAYIRKEYHDRILKIIQVIGNNELTLFSYLDNVLEYHMCFRKILFRCIIKRIKVFFN